MKILIDSENILIDYAEDITYDSVFIRVEKPNEINTYMAHDKTILSDITMSEEIKAQKYKYINGNFVLNEKYIEEE